MKQRISQPGFTLIETLVVVLVLLIILGVAASFFFIDRRNSLRDSKQTLLFSLQWARASSIAGLEDHNWGVRIEPDRLTTFIGPVYDPDNNLNRTYFLETGVQAAALLNPPSQDLIFDRLSGFPDRIGTITLSAPSGKVVLSIGGKGRINEE